MVYVGKFGWFFVNFIIMFLEDDVLFGMFDFGVLGNFGNEFVFGIFLMSVVEFLFIFNIKRCFSGIVFIGFVYLIDL